MIFKPVTVNDKAIISPYLIKNQYGICDFSFANLILWKHIYDTYFVIHKGALILKSHLGNHEPHFLMPIVLDPSAASMEVLLNDLIAYCEQEGIAFKMEGLTLDMIESLRKCLPGQFEVTQPKSFDYLYLTEDLITLKGKRYQAKRNHINRFNANYNYEYHDIDSNNIHLCKDIFSKWNETHHDEDRIAVELAIEHYTDLGLHGGMLLVDGEAVAFTMGQPNNEFIFDIHIEKALSSYEGAYAKINQEFAMRHCKDYHFINREEDLGIDGLRKAKMSYYPALFLHKCLGSLNQCFE